jgi:hypothetical protein
MGAQTSFRQILPASQVTLGVVFGGWGLWQRNKILSHDYLFGTGWNSTARFHVWPWPFKFAVIENFPAFLAGALLSWPTSEVKPDLPEALQIAPSLFFVGVLWYWIGRQVDQRWHVREAAPWFCFFMFTIVCVVGALLRIGYTDYLPYAFFIWVGAVLAFRYVIKRVRRS